VRAGSGKAVSVCDASATFPPGAVLADSSKPLPLLAAGSMPRVRVRARVRARG